VTTVDARKTAMKKNDALKLTQDVDEIYVAKGKNIVHLNLKTDKPAPAQIAELIIGPTGNLRAPTFTVGRTLVVGFNEDAYKKILKA
jgi:arsenate reductase-like glutaredoxin family protein